MVSIGIFMIYWESVEIESDSQAVGERGVTTCCVSFEKKEYCDGI